MMQSAPVSSSATLGRPDHDRLSAASFDPSSRASIRRAATTRAGAWRTTQRLDRDLHAMLGAMAPAEARGASPDARRVICGPAQARGRCTWPGARVSCGTRTMCCRGATSIRLPLWLAVAA
jgi:hypothetical protein